MNKGKKALNTWIRLCAVCCGLFLIIHRRVIAACLTGVEMPEAPEWHKKCCKQPGDTFDKA